MCKTHTAQSSRSTKHASINQPIGTIPAGAMYNDGGRYLDKQAFAAAWLFKATGACAFVCPSP